MLKDLQKFLIISIAGNFLVMGILCLNGDPLMAEKIFIHYVPEMILLFSVGVLCASVKFPLDFTLYLYFVCSLWALVIMNWFMSDMPRLLIVGLPFPIGHLVYRYSNQKTD